MRRKKRINSFEVFNTIFMMVLMVVALYPLLYVVFASFSDPWELVKHKGFLVRPLGFSLQGYQAVFKNRSIITGYMTTLINLFGGTSLNIILTLFAAYGLSRKSLLWKKPITVLVVFTMFFSSGIIPRFLVVRSLGLYDSRLSMILPTAINVFNLVIMRTAIEGLPNSLEEAAIMSDIETYRDENAIRYILGTENFDNYDKFVQTIKGMNLERAIEIKQDAYDRLQERVAAASK